MNDAVKHNVEPTKSGPWLEILAVIALCGTVFCYYKLPDWMGDDVSLLIKAAVMIAGIVISSLIAAFSSSGKQLIEFSKGSRIELRKMVWPSRAETGQTTMIVLILVVLVALFLWLIDVTVFEVIYDYFLGVDD